MITQIQSFIRPSQSSYYLASPSLQAATEALDANRDGRLGRDEVSISAQLSRQIDSNRDGMLQLFEVQDALETDQLSLQNLSGRASDALAGSLIRNRVYTAGLGQLGVMVDQDRDGFVSRRELSTALNSGRVMLSGSYLSAVGSSPNQPDYPGYGYGADEARRTISAIEGQKMKLDSWGNPDPNTGIFKPEEANARIKAYFEKEVLPNPGISLADKFELLKSQRMGRDSWGNYTPAKGSLKEDELSSLAKQAAHLAKPDSYRPGSATEMLAALATERQKADSWGNDDPKTGLLKPADANALIKQLLSKEVLPNPRIGHDEKLAIIKEHTMKRDSWGNEMPRSGALTQEEARRLSQQVFDQPSQPGWNQDAIKPGQSHQSDPFARPGSKPGHTADPFARPGSKPASGPGTDPFKK